MPKSFESLLETIIPEVNFLTIASSELRPGHLLESTNKDVITAFLPDLIKEVPELKHKSFETTKEIFFMNAKELSGIASNSSALVLMNYLGLKFNSNKAYRVHFNISEITSEKFINNLDKINFEIALQQFKNKGKVEKNIFKRFKRQFLVMRVLFASSFEISVEVKNGASYEAISEHNNLIGSFNTEIKKKDNVIVVNGGNEIPFGVIGFEIRDNKLKPALS